VDSQIAQMRANIAAEEKITHRDESTDRNLVYDRLKEDLAKAKAELPGLQARADRTSQDLIVYRERARRLSQKDLELNDLLRTQKLADDSYQLYFRKQEDARITDALDKQRIINVAVIERAVPALQPSGISRTMIVLIAAVLAGLLSMGLAYALDLLDSSFRTPDEVRAFLNVPVLAAVPMNKR